MKRLIFNQGKNMQHLLYSAAQLTLLTIALTSCARDSTLGSVDWENGARRGVVADVIESGGANSPRARCLTRKIAEDNASRPFVEVRYRGAKLIRSSIASAPDTLKLKKGDIVELYPADCHAGTIGRVTRILGRGDATP